MTNPPTIGTSWITVNTASATTQGYDTGLIETSAVATSGWTMLCVARFPGVSGNMGMMAIGTTNALGFVINPANANVSSHPSIYVAGFSYSLSADNSLDLGAGTDQTKWRMYSLAWAGGSNQFYTLRDLTGGLNKTTTVAQTRAGAATNHMTIGTFQGSGNTTSTAVGDIAASCIATGVLSLTVQNQIRTWWQGVLAVRGVTGF
jgi:hypothetical protein